MRCFWISTLQRRWKVLKQYHSFNLRRNTSLEACRSSIVTQTFSWYSSPFFYGIYGSTSCPLRCICELEFESWYRHLPRLKSSGMLLIHLSVRCFWFLESSFLDLFRQVQMRCWSHWSLQMWSHFKFCRCLHNIHFRKHTKLRCSRRWPLSRTRRQSRQSWLSDTRLW